MSWVSRPNCHVIGSLYTDGVDIRGHKVSGSTVVEELYYPATDAMETAALGYETGGAYFNKGATVMMQGRCFRAKYDSTSTPASVAIQELVLSGSDYVWSTIYTINNVYGDMGSGKLVPTQYSMTYSNVWGALGYAAHYMAAYSTIFNITSWFTNGEYPAPWTNSSSYTSVPNGFEGYAPSTTMQSRTNLYADIRSVATGDYAGTKYVYKLYPLYRYYRQYTTWPYDATPLWADVAYWRSYGGVNQYSLDLTTWTANPDTSITPIASFYSTCPCGYKVVTTDDYHYVYLYFLDQDNVWVDKTLVATYSNIQSYSNPILSAVMMMTDGNVYTRTRYEDYWGYYNYDWGFSNENLYGVIPDWTNPESSGHRVWMYKSLDGGKTWTNRGITIA